MHFFTLREVRGVGAFLAWITAVAVTAAVIQPSTAGLERVRIPPLPGSVVSAYPSVELLGNGRLFCVFSARHPQKDKLVLASTQSTDHGRNWSTPNVLLDSADGNDYDPSIMVIGPRIIVSATTTPVNESSITTSRIMAVRSDDDGQTWSQPYEIQTGRRYTSGKVNNGIVLEDGTALLGYTWEKNLDEGATSLAGEGDMEEVNAVLLSYDNGRTWASSQSIGLKARRSTTATNAINGLCEPAIVECRDGSVFMLSRTGLTNLYGARSFDNGRSWSKPFQTPLVSHNSPAAICRFGDGAAGVLAVWNNSPEHRWPLSVAASFDDCHTWTTPRVIASEAGLESSYPCAVQTGDGKILVVYQQAREKGREIIGVRFDPSWLTERGDLEKSSESSDEARATQRKKSRDTTSPKTVARFTSMPKPAVLPGDTLALYFIDHRGPGLPDTPAAQTVYVRYSRDKGKTWTSPETLIDLPSEQGGFGYFVVQVDQIGEVHLLMLCDAGTGVIRPRRSESGQLPVEPLSRQRLDIWHVKSTDGRTGWTEPRQIWQGRAGDLQSITQLENGRIILPVSYLVDRNWANRGEGPQAYTYTGQFDTTVLYSDDSGNSWKQSPSVLRTVTPDLASYGAVEPVVLQLRDGRVWMLLRTQLGRFYESFSETGAEWTPPQPSKITSSDSPAALVRLPDDRILMIWNNCQRHPYAQGSRHVLHAAISEDEGHNWIGYREILRDPFRKQPPPPNGDHGVSYPFATALPDGDVFYSLWVQSGEGRTLERLDPVWLDESTLQDNFAEGLANWSTFGSRGATIVDDPQQQGNRVLSLAKQDANWPTAAVWNFPKGLRGQIRIEMAAKSEEVDLSIQLSDHFSPPADEQSQLYSVFHAEITSGTNPSATQIAIEPDTWTDFKIDWDCTEGIAQVYADGKLVRTLRQQHMSPGPSYLRLVLASGMESSEPVLVRSVDASVSTECVSLNQ